MALSTYSELQASIADYLNRDDLTAAVPDFITLAEASINRDLKHWRLEKRATTTISGRFAPLPLDFVSPIRLQVGETIAPLDPISVQDMHDRRAASNDSTGTPRFYAVIGDEFEVFPTPSEGAEATLYYRATAPVLSDVEPTNWILSQAPDVYLYGALVHSAPYLKDDARLQVWAALYTAAVVALNKQGDAGKHGGAGKRRRVRK